MIFTDILFTVIAAFVAVQMFILTQLVRSVLEATRTPRYLFVPMSDEDGGDDDDDEDDEPTHPAPPGNETINEALDRLQPSSPHVRLGDAPVTADFRSSVDRMMEAIWPNPYADGVLDQSHHEIDGRHEWR
jgi:hypothetical protein